MNEIRYVAYVRKSTEDIERQVLSIEAQKNKITERFGDLNIVDYLEESKSAFETGKRPIFDSILNMIDDGKIDGVIAWHPDRLSRNAIDAGGISHRVTKGKIKDLKFVSYTFDNSPEGMMMLQMTMSQSQYFSSKLSKDIRRGNETKRKNGGLTGRAPEGYLNDRIHKSVIKDPERFTLIRKAFDLFLTGEYSVQTILRIMNEEWGFRTLQRNISGGGKLSRTALYGIFRNVRYAGLVPDPYDNDKYYQGTYPAMITVDEFDRVQMLLGKKGKPRLCASKQFVLRGFIRCGECGCMITAERKHKNLKSGGKSEHVYYHCTRKRPCSQRVNVKESDLYSQVTGLLDKYELIPELYQWGLDALKDIAAKEIKSREVVQNSINRAMQSTQGQLDRLLDLVTKGVIEETEYLTKSSALKEDLRRLQEEQADSTNRVKNWYEFVGNTLEILTEASTKFGIGDITYKKEILLAIGQNPVLLEGKLHVTPNFWLKPVGDNAVNIKEELKKVRTMPLQMQKASEEAIKQTWCSIIDEVRTLFICQTT